MKTAKSGMFSWKRRRGNPAAVFARLLSALFAIFLPVRISMGPALRKLTFVAVAASLALSPVPSAFSEDGSAIAGHASLADLETTEHGHSHDDEGPMDHSAAHKHGHDPADHSHQFAFLTAGSNQWGMPPTECWLSVLSGSPDGALGLGIERPPRQSTSL